MTGQEELAGGKTWTSTFKDAFAALPSLRSFHRSRDERSYWDLPPVSDAEVENALKFLKTTAVLSSDKQGRHAASNKKKGLNAAGADRQVNGSKSNGLRACGSGQIATMSSKKTPSPADRARDAAESTHIAIDAATSNKKRSASADAGGDAKAARKRGPGADDFVRPARKKQRSMSRSGDEEEVYMMSGALQ